MVKDFIIQVSDAATAESTDIVLSRQDVLAVRREADESPVSPLLVKKIEAASRDKGYLLVADQQELYRVAKEIIVEGGHYFSLAGHRLGQASTASSISRDRARPQPQAGRLFCCKYRNPLNDLEELREQLEGQGMITVLWNSTNGFDTRHLSRQFPLFDKANPASLRDARKALSFVIDNPVSRIAYIFEDIHHFIGDKDGISPAIGEVRSLIKALYRSLTEREEKVFFFVPDSYDIPSDITVFLNDAGLFADRRSGSFLERVGTLMTSSAYVSKIKPVIGARKLIERIIQTLSQMEGNNPLLVGHPGVGKTAVVEGFALALSQGKVPANLRGRELISLSLGSLVAGTKYRGELEGRLEKLMDEALQHRDEIILFIDEIQGLLDAGMAEGGFGIGDVLKPVLARGEFPLIGATTFVGAEHLAKDPALTRRFGTIVVDEPSLDETLEILRGLRSSLEKYHGVAIDNTALVAAVRASERFRPEAYRPGKIIALVDSAAAYCRIKGRERVQEMDILREVNRG